MDKIKYVYINMDTRRIVSDGKTLVSQMRGATHHKAIPSEKHKCVIMASSKMFFSDFEVIDLYNKLKG